MGPNIAAVATSTEQRRGARLGGEFEQSTGAARLDVTGRWRFQCAPTAASRAVVRTELCSDLPCLLPTSAVRLWLLLAHVSVTRVDACFKARACALHLYTRES